MGLPLSTARLALRPFTPDDGADLYPILVCGFDDLRLERMVAVAEPRNRACLRVLEELGMTLVGPLFCYGADLIEHALTAAARGSGNPGARL